MILQKAREKGFWIYDKLRGAKVENHYKDISAILNNLSQSKDKIAENLSNLLFHAVRTTAYYSSLKVNYEIEDFPVVNKNIIRNNYEQFISVDFAEDQLKAVVTSGSTGTPFKVLQNREKTLRNNADTIYFSQLAEYDIGQRLYYLKIWNDENSKSVLTSLTQNIVPVDVRDQSDTFFEKFVKDLEYDKAPKSFLGYASAFEALCQYLDNTDIEKVSTPVQSIIAMSEALNNYTKRRLKKYFDCEAVSRYSNIENGILAQQKRGDSRFFLNRASYFFEVLEVNSDKKAPVGKPGRIVVTDLFNYGMPMIRYDTGDIGILDYDDSGVPMLSQVEGRKMDMIYNTDGKLVSSFVITNNMWKYQDIKQYQFVQESADSYYFKINPNAEFNKEKELVNEFREYFGKDAKIRVEYVSEIPLLSSGKRKKVVNEWNEL